MAGEGVEMAAGGEQGGLTDGADADGADADGADAGATDAVTPGIVGDAFIAAEPGHGGAVWRLEPATRGLDANVIVLPAGDEIQRHVGPALDVLLVVLEGSGTLETDGEDIALERGRLVWLPPRSERRIVAGGGGLRYFSVHGRKPGLGATGLPLRQEAPEVTGR